MSTPPDPCSYDFARALAAENADLRTLLEAVAQEIERLACRRSSGATEIARTRDPRPRSQLQ